MEVKVMPGERVVFVEENNPQQYVKLVANGEVDAVLLDVVGDYLWRQKKRLGIKGAIGVPGFRRRDRVDYFFRLGPRDAPRIGPGRS